MKRFLNLLLLASLTVAMGLSVTSCKDDDDNNKSEEEQQQEQEAKASKFWSVVGQLVSSDDYTVDYEGKTFEPVIGTPESEGSLTRIVETNDMQTAARRFADLVSVDGGSPAVDENTPSYTWSDPEVGTLTYTRGGTAAEWATVDVNIKQLPRLRKIVYRVGGEGTNASFDGKAWYRFGDVVSRTNKDGQKEYWICVRPAFSPESKGDSHWVCLNVLPAKNVYKVDGSNGKQYYVPTGVGTDKEDMQNLAEMLYAISRPEQWYKNATDFHTDGKLWGFSGLPIFADFTKAKLMYHNQYFWERVKEAWTKYKVAENAMNVDFATLESSMEDNGINLLYNGYSWWTKTSWNCTLYQASYTNGAKNAEKNLHHAEYTKPEKNMRDIVFDCRTMGQTTANYQAFFNNDGKLRWVVRHATGKELNGGAKIAATSKLQAGCVDEYRYYDEYPEEWTKADPNGGNGPEISDEFVPQQGGPNPGELVGADGKFYENKAACEAAGTRPIAMVVYVSTDRHRVEKGQPWTGLAMELSDLKEDGDGDDNDIFRWAGYNSGNSCLCSSAVSQGSGERGGAAEVDYFACVLDGWAMTKRLATHQCNAKDVHKPAELAWSSENRPEGFSEWFIPSVGQYILAMKGMGYERERRVTSYTWGFTYDGKWLWEQAGVPEAGWTSSKYKDGKYFFTTTQAVDPRTVITFLGNELSSHDKSCFFRIRRMIAFGDGATIDPPAYPQPIEPRPGAVLAASNYCFANVADMKAFDYTHYGYAEGMVVYFSKSKRVEKGENYCGLAISLTDREVDGSKDLAWCGDDKKLGEACGKPVGSVADYAGALNGKAVRDDLIYRDDDHIHPAAKSPIGGKFLPSAGQWILAMEGLGSTWNAATGKFSAAAKWPWNEAGLSESALDDTAEYWTCTEQKDGDTYKVLSVQSGSTSFKMHSKTDKLRVRPFIAFGEWGTED